MPTIPGLKNTAEGFTYGDLETNYSLAVVQGNTVAGANGYVSPDANIGTWLANSVASKWLSIGPNGGITRYDGANLGSTVDGIYRWRITFDLTGYDASSAWIELRCLADNDIRVELNGNVKLDYLGNSPAANFTAWKASFIINSGFSAGINTLDFFVKNWLLAAFPDGSGTGFRAEFIESYAGIGQANALMFSCNT